jgi:hypothetical protein
MKLNAGLNPKRTKFCQLVAGGKGPSEAYAEAYELDDNQPTSAAYNLMKLDTVQMEIKRLQIITREITDHENLLTRNEKRKYLAGVVRANVLTIDPDNPDDPSGWLVESVIRQYDKEGNLVRTTVKLPSKLQALEMDNKMTGENQPDVIEHKISGGVMLIPTGGDTLDAWEKIAMSQQGSLKDGAIDLSVESDDVD